MHRPDESPALGFCVDRDAACYSPERDGPLEEYLELQFDGMVCRLFKGMEHFQMLRDKGWLLPNVSTIRLMYNAGRGDEHYLVTVGFQLQGIVHAHHGGREGVLAPEDILADAPPFEAQSLYGPAYEANIRRLEDGARKKLEELGLVSPDER